MRKHLLLILMLTALFPWSLRAQTLTVADGTATNIYIPFYGYNADGTQQSQIIYPANLLTSMIGNDITEMVFYTSTTGNNAYNGNWKLKLGICEDAAFSNNNYDQTTTTVEVYAGILTRVGATQTVTITFDSPFNYTGGNLLFDLRNYTVGAWNATSFYGISSPNASIYSPSGNTNNSGNLQSFLPKTTFAYETPPTCPKPTALAVSNITSAGATLSWTSSASSFVVAYGTDTDPEEMPTVNPATNSATLTGLNANTVYNVFVKAVCGANDESEWSAMKTFRTDCEAVDLTTLGVIGFETSEGFVTGTNPSSPNCWTFDNMQSSSTSYIPYIYNSTYYAYDENNSLKLYAYKYSSINYPTNADSAYAVMPEFLTTNVSRYMLRFYARQGSTSSTYAKNLVVGVMTDPTEMSTFVQVGSANVVGTTYAQYEVSLADYTGTGKYIAFLAAVDPESNATSRYADYYVDNLEVMLIPSCVRPTDVAVDNINTTSAKISWVAGADETAWQVAYSTDGETWTQQPVNAGTNPFTLTGLTSNTHYYVKVRSYCDADDQSEYTAVTDFYTACEVLNITKENPFVESFDNFTGSSSNSANNLPNCWNYVNTSANSSYYNYPIVYNSSSYSANNCIKFYHYYSSSSDQYLVLPEVSNDANTLMLQLYAKTSGTTTAYVRSFIVGVMDDPTNASTFTAVDTVSNLTTNYALYESYLDGYEGNGNYVAIKVAKPVSGTYSYVYVDDIKLKLIPTCFPVESISFADVERTSMTINWTKNSNPAADNTDYQVVLSTTQLDADGLAAADHVDVEDATTYNAINLERNTLYYVYVRSSCDNGDDYSEWVEATQRTPDLGADCSVSSLEQTIGTGTSAIQYLPWSDFYKSTYSQQIYTAAEMTAAGFSAGYITKVAFQYALSASYTKTVTIYMGTTTDASFSSTSYKEVTAVTSATATTFNTAGAWYEFEFDTPFYWDGTSNIVVGAMNIGTDYPTSGTPTFYGGTTTGSMALYSRTDNGTPSTVTGTLTTNRANIKITVCPPASACPEITNLAAVTTVDEATITWTPSTGDYVGRYEIIHSDVQLSQGALNQQYEENDHHGDERVTDPTVTVSGLAENTQYYIYISTVCDANSHDDGMSDWVEFSYKTKANCLTPVGLDATVNGKKDVTVTWANDSYDSEREIYVQESNFYWILATDDITEGGNIDIDINHSAVVVHNFDDENGITDDHAQITFSEAEINVLDHNKTYYFYVRNECGNGGAWVSTTFTTPDECPAVVNLEVSNETAHTALLTWDKGEFGEETEWKVKWGNNEFYTTERSFLVYGLAAEETTQVSVYAACDKNHGVFGTAATVDVTTIEESGGTIIIANGTATNSFIPVYGLYCDAVQETQTIYPASELTALVGKTITGVKYFVQSGSSANWATIPFTVKMGVTEDATLSGITSTTSLTTVYTGTLSASTSAGMSITFNTPFTYTGGNLLVDFSETAPSSYTSCTFYGKSSTSASYCKYGSSGSQQSFLPKMEVSVAAESCPKVTTFNVDDITTTTANVSWMPAGGEMKWNYVVSTSAALDANALDAHTDASVIAYNDEDYAQRFVELNGLTPDTHYFLYVQSICDAESESVSAWSAPYEFVTIATCPAPTALLVSNITNESVQLAWTKGGDEGEWEVAYSTNGANWSTATATTNPYTLQGLSGNTDYQVKVKAVCSETDDSYYTPVVNFTTECDALVIGTSGYTEDFESYSSAAYASSSGTMPDCWESIFTGTSLGYNVKTCSYSSYAPDGSGKYVVIVVSTYTTYGASNYAIFPAISNDYDNLNIEFDYKINTTSNCTINFGYLTDITNASTFTAIGDALTLNTTKQHANISLASANVPANARLAIKATATSSSTCYIGIDNIFIKDVTTFIDSPKNLQASNISNSGATLNWTAGSTEEKWQYVYGESGFTPDWTNPSEVAATTCTLTGLSSNTDYDVYVRSWYNAGKISEPVMISFTTECDALDLTYFEDFESYSSSATAYNVAGGIMPNCWDSIFSGTNPIYAPHISASYAPTATGIVLTSGSETYGSDNYVILPAFNGVQNSKISYSYMMEDDTRGTLYFGYITDATDASTFVPLNQLTSYESKTDVSDYVVAGKVPANARLAFKWHHTSSYYSVGIDNISVSSVNVFNTDGNIATPANWSGAEVPATTGYIAAEATVSADFTIADLNILEGGKVTVNNGATLTVTGTLTNNDEANLVINDGSQLVNASATKATVKKEITAYSTATGTDADGWYLIASPITNAAASMVTIDNYDFYAHDEAAYMWRNYKVAANQTDYSWLTNGYGYLYANADNQILNFAGTVAADGEKEIELDYTSTGTNTGWNLLGNHTAHNVTIKTDFGLLSVKVMDNDGIDYTDKLVSTNTFAPCEGFFVKATAAGQHVTINPTSTAKSQEAPQGFIQLNLVDNNTPVFTDVAYITMEGGIGSENITFSEVSPQLYVPMNGVDYSVAVVDADLTVIPVGFKATANSSYTISLNLINAHFETVILRDLKTGIDTDLKAGNYVFNGDIDDSENRFNLILAVEAPEGIGENNEPFAYQSGSDIIFTDAYGTVQVMDVLGRVMSETRIDGAARISTRGLVSGTYVLRLLGNESVRTQKIVVK